MEIGTLIARPAPGHLWTQMQYRFADVGPYFPFREFDDGRLESLSP